MASASNADTTTITASSSSEHALPPGSDGKCDMCWGAHGDHGFRLLQCQKCHLRVHDECYGLVSPPAPNESPTNNNPNNNDNNQNPSDTPSWTSFWFTCWACQSVGSVVKFRQRDPATGKRLQFAVTERPTECCLCSVDDGLDRPHAMHPLYDDYGLKGRQIRLPPSKPSSLGVLAQQQSRRGSSTTTLQGPETGKLSSNNLLPARPAWAHTLCAMFMNSAKVGGFVFGCFKDGTFGGEQDEDDMSLDREEVDPARLVWDDDTASLNSALGHGPTDNNDDDDDDGNLHHFVFMQEKWYGKQNESVKLIKERQTELKCIQCASRDEGTLRVAMQCFANDDDEWEVGQGTHTDLGGQVRISYTQVSKQSQQPPFETTGGYQRVLGLNRVILTTSLSLSTTIHFYLQDCYQAMHVGCAFYGPGSQHPNCRRVYFFPGNDDGDPIFSLYCSVHAKDLPQPDDPHAAADDDAFAPKSHEQLEEPEGEEQFDEDEESALEDSSPDHQETKKRKRQQPTTTKAKPHNPFHGNNRNKLKQHLLMNERRANSSSNKTSSDLVVRAGGGGGHGRNFGRSSGSCVPCQPSTAMRSGSLLQRRREELRREELALGKRIARRPQVWNRKRRNRFQQDWKSRPPDPAVMAALEVAPLVPKPHGTAARTSSMESITMNYEFTTFKQLKKDMTYDLVEALKSVEGPDATGRLTKTLIAKWKRQLGDAISNEEFKKHFEKARVMAKKEIEQPLSTTLYKRVPANPNVDVKAYLEELDFDSIQKGIAQGMIKHLDKEIRKLETLDETSGIECARRIRIEQKRINSTLKNDEFKMLWITAKRVVGRRYNVSLKVVNNKKTASKNQNEENTENNNNNNQRPPSITINTGQKHGGEASSQTGNHQEGDNEDNLLDFCEDERSPGGQSGTSMVTSEDELYRQAVQKISTIKSTEPHLPLHSILESEQTRYSEMAMQGTISEAQFDHTWKRVVKESQNLFQKHLASSKKNPMDWSFLFAGSSFDASKSDSFLSDFDLMDGDSV